MTIYLGSMGSVGFTILPYLNELLTSMMLVNGVNKEEGGEEGEQSNGVLIEHLQNLLCLKCFTE